MKYLAIIAALLMSNFAFAEPHKVVQAALDYELRENTCTKPKVIAQNTTSTAPAQDTGSASFFEGSSTAQVSDVDGYTRRRQEKKEKRWRKCVAEYKEDLLDDIQRLKGSAQHGLTQAQADTILGNMALIQKVYMTPEGVLEETAQTAAPKNAENG